MLRRMLIILGFCLISFNGWFSLMRVEANSHYLLYGEEYDTNTGVAQYYIYSPYGEQLFPIKDAVYSGDFPYFDLMWSPTGYQFFHSDATTSHVSIESLDGNQRRLIADIPYSAFYDIERGMAPDKRSFVTVTKDTDELPYIAIYSVLGDLINTINLPTMISKAYTPFWSPDSIWIYAPICESINGENTCHLYRVYPDGGNWAKLSEITISERFESFRWSPDGKKLAFMSDNNLWLTIPNERGLYQKAPVFSDDFNRSATRFTWSPDSQWIVYQHDATTLKRLNASADSMNEIILASAQIINLLWCDDAWVYYWASEEEDTSVADLYRVPLAGGSPQLIFSNGVKGSGWDYGTPLIVDENWLIIPQVLADQSVIFYRLHHDGTHPEIVFDPVTIRPGGTGYNLIYQLSPDKRWVLVGGRNYAWQLSYQFRVDGSHAIDFRDYSNPDRTRSIYIDPSPDISMPYHRWGVSLGVLILLLGIIPSIRQNVLRLLRRETS